MNREQIATFALMSLHTAARNFAEALDTRDASTYARLLAEAACSYAKVKADETRANARKAKAG